MTSAAGRFVAGKAGTLTVNRTPCLQLERQAVLSAPNPASSQQGPAASYAHSLWGLCHQTSAELDEDRTTGGEGDSKNLAESRVRLNPNSCALPEANFANFPEGRTPPRVGLEDHGRLSPGLALTSTMADPTNCCVAAPSLERPAGWGEGLGSSTAGGS